MNDKTKGLIKSIAFYFIVGILLLYITLQVVAPRTVLTVFRFQPYVVVTTSMEPLIDENDIVFVKNYDVEDLKVGDIITFSADVDLDGEKDTVTHYIYSITDTGDSYRIRTNRYFEDENDVYADFWVINDDDVLGLYNFHIPWVGTIVRFMKSPFGIAAILVNIGVIVGVVYLIKTSPKEEPKKQEETKE